MRSQQEIEQLYEEYEYLVGVVINSHFNSQSYYNTHTITKEDVMQYGRIGLYYACRKYNENKEASFKTYAVKCIKWSVLNHCKSESSVKISYNSQDTITKINLDDLNETELANFKTVCKSHDLTQDKELLSYALKDVPSNVCDMIHMRLEGYSLKEIGEKYNLTPQAVNQRIKRQEDKITNRIKIFNQM